MKEIFWNKETIDYFIFQSNYINEKQMRESVKDFVECDCVPEEGETEEELIADLMNKIYE